MAVVVIRRPQAALWALAEPRRLAVLLRARPAVTLPVATHLQAGLAWVVPSPAERPQVALSLLLEALLARAGRHLEARPREEPRRTWCRSTLIPSTFLSRSPKVSAGRTPHPADAKRSRYSIRPFLSGATAMTSARRSSGSRPEPVCRSTVALICNGSLSVCQKRRARTVNTKSLPTPPEQASMNQSRCTSTAAATAAFSGTSSGTKANASLCDPSPLVVRERNAHGDVAGCACVAPLDQHLIGAHNAAQCGRLVQANCPRANCFVGGSESRGRRKAHL